MEATDTLKVTGRIDFEHYTGFNSVQRLFMSFLNLFSNTLVTNYARKNGTLVESWGVTNLVVTTGKALITARLGASASAVAAYLALGTSNTATSAGQTALIAEISDSGLTRQLATFTQQTTTTTNDTFQLVYTWTASGTKTVEEVGVFNAASTGTMLARALTTTRNFVNNDTYIGTYKVIIA